MKKLFLAAAIITALSACSTATLININVDGISFIPAASRTPPPLPVVAGPDVSNIEIPVGGLAVPLPTLNFLTKIALKINVGVVADVPGSISGSLQLFIAPTNTNNLYDPANQVPTGANCVGDLAVNGTDPISIDLSLNNNSPAACGTAFNRVKSGQFKIGSRVSFTITANSTVTITLTDLKVGVSGYPVQILQ
jgi:hypothetical protein